MLVKDELLMIVPLGRSYVEGQIKRLEKYRKMCRGVEKDEEIALYTELV